MKKPKKILFTTMAFVVILALFPHISLRAFANSEPYWEFDKFFANGVPITIEAGTGNKTKIKYGDQYFDFGGGVYEKDLSDYDVFGGSNKGSVESTSITMTGGHVRLLLGGGRLQDSHVNGDVEIHISDNATISTLYGGGDSNAKVSGDVNIKISGGTIKHSVVGGGTNNASVENTNITITGGTIKEYLFGGGGNNSNVNGNALIRILGNSDIGNILAGGNNNSSIEGKARIEVTNGNIKNIYGGGNFSNMKNTEITITGGNIKNVYGAGLENGNVLEDSTIDISGATISGKIEGVGLKNSTVNGQKNAIVTIAAHTNLDSFDNALSKSNDGNWNMKGNVTIENRNITVEENKTFTIANTSTLTLNGNASIANHGTLELEGTLSGNPNITNHGTINLGGTLNATLDITNNATLILKDITNNGILNITNHGTVILESNNLNGTVNITGNGTLQTAKNDLTEDDIILQENYPYTGEIIEPVHSLKKITVLGKEFEISNWKFESVSPELVKDVGTYTLTYKKEGADDRITKDFSVTQVEQRGSINLELRDTNNDNKVNAGDILSVNLSKLSPKGGTPSYQWKKKSGNSELPIGTGATYTIRSTDAGEEIYCVVSFSDNTTGNLETDKIVSKLPAPEIIFPTASSIVQGKKLKDSILKGGSTEYGSFAWKHPQTVPALQNTGYEVEFTPSPQTVAKYEKITETVKKVPITVYRENSDSTDEGNENEGTGSRVSKVERIKKKLEKKKADPKDKNTSKIDLPFTDVKPDDYFAEAVAWAIQKGITDGTSKTTFSPYDVCTRAQIVTFLWRAAGKPQPLNQTSFNDINSEHYYSEAVKWASQHNIVSGTSTNMFSPDASSTRAQALTMLYRYSGSPNVSENIEFDDVKTQTYYTNAIIWGTQKGITKGTGESKFSPDLECNRAQIITFLYRMHQLK